MSDNVKCLFSWGNQQYPITHAVPSSNRSIFAIAFDNGNLRIVDPMELRTLHNIESWHDAFTALAFSPDDSRLITVSRDNTARIWDVDSGKILTSFSSPEMVSAVALSTDNQLAATGSMGMGNLIRIWDISSGDSLHELRGHEGFLTYLKFIESEDTFLSVAADEIPRFWNINSNSKKIGKCKECKGHKEMVTCLATNENGYFFFLITGSEDKTVRAWLRGAARPLTFKGLQAEVTACAISPDAKRFFYVGGSGDGEVCFWSHFGPLEHRLNLFPGPVRALQFSADGGRLLAAGAEGKIKIVDTNTWQTTIEFQSGRVGASEVWWGIDESRVITFAPYCELAIWEIQGASSRKYKSTKEKPDSTFEGLYQLTVQQYNEQKWNSPDGRNAYQIGAKTGKRKKDRTGYIRLIRIKDKTCLHEWDTKNFWTPGFPFGDRLRFFEDGEKLSLATDSCIEIWQIDPPECLHVFESARSYAASSDGALFASCTTGQEVTIRSLENGELIRTLEGNKNIFGAMAFSPDNTKLAVADNLTLSLWDLKTGKELYRSDEFENAEKIIFDDGGKIIAVDHIGQRHVIDTMETFIDDFDAKAVKTIALPKSPKILEQFGQVKTKRGFRTKIFREFDDLGEFKGAAFCPDGKAMLVCDANSLHVNTIRSNKERLRFDKPVKGFEKAVFLSAGKSLLTINDGEGAAQLWDLEKHTRKVDFRCEDVDGIVSPDQSLFIGGDAINRIGWDLKNGKKLFQFDTTGEGDKDCDTIESSAISPDGKYLLMSDCNQAIQMFDLQSRQRVGIFTPKKKDDWGLQPKVGFIGQGSQFFVCSKMETIEIFDTKSFKRRHVITENMLGSEVTSSPDGSFLLVLGLGKIFIIDPATGKSIRENQIGHRHFSCCTMSPNGKRIYYGKRDGSVLVLDTTTWEFTQRYTGIGGETHTIFCSPDGTKIAVRYFEGVDLIDVKKQKMIGRIQIQIPLSWPTPIFNDDWSLFALRGHQDIRVWQL